MTTVMTITGTITAMATTRKGQAASATNTGVCRATRTTATTMAEAASPQTLLRLMTWLSPAFPVGAFTYSHGLEQAIHDGLIRDRATLVDWLTICSSAAPAGTMRCCWPKRGGCTAGGDCSEVAELAEALAGSKERQMETTLQGERLRRDGGWQACDSRRGRERLAGRGWPLQHIAYPSRPQLALSGRRRHCRRAARHRAWRRAGAYPHAFASNLIQACGAARAARPARRRGDRGRAGAGHAGDGQLAAEVRRSTISAPAR